LLVGALAQAASSWELAVPVDAVTLADAGDAARVIGARLVNAGWRIQVKPVHGGEPLEVLVPRDRLPIRPIPSDDCTLTIDGARCQLLPRDGELAPGHRPHPTWIGSAEQVAGSAKNGHREA
jgi:hypothetical protein